MSFPIVANCRHGHGGESVSPALHFGLANVAVKALVDRWAGRAHRYFKLLDEDGTTCIVRNDLPSGLWPLAFYDREQEPAR